MEDLVVPEGGFVVSNEDTKELPPYEPFVKKYKTPILPDPEIEIKFYADKPAGRVAVYRVGNLRDYRVVPADVELSLRYPTKIKTSLWNTFVEWKR